MVIKENQTENIVSEVSNNIREPRMCDHPPMAGKTLYDRVCEIPPFKIDPEILRTLETLREKPITFLNLHDIPCREISGEEVRQTEPLVSVVVSAYNHEKYIAETFDGILRQKTNFPYEIVVGEDCSTDRTREIVLEYQKKHPDLFRVLYSDQNLHQIGSSNPQRCTYAARGRFMAFCEGDDYWVDDEKMQKQVDLFQTHPNINVIFTGGYHFFQETGKLVERPIYGLNGEIRVEDSLYDLLTKPIYQQHRLCSSMFRSAIFEKRSKEDGIANAMLTVGDRKIWIFCALNGSLYYMNDLTSVYRRQPESITSSELTKYIVTRDSRIVSLFYLAQNGNILPFARKNISLIADIALANIRLAGVGKRGVARRIAQCRKRVNYVFNRSIPIRVRLGVIRIIQKKQLIRLLQKIRFIYTPLRSVHHWLLGAKNRQEFDVSRFDRF